jgi:hypothetical protein
MAALSPAQENAVSPWLLVSFLVVMLALPVAVVIAAWARRTSRAEFPWSSPPRTDNPPAEGADAGPDLPRHASEPPAPALPRRIAGQSGVAYAGDPARPPGMIRPPRASRGPPWGPAPEPGVPAHYGGRVIDTSTGREWRCPHNHPTEESATRCADFMQEQIRRLGWDKATGERP